MKADQRVLATRLRRAGAGLAESALAWAITMTEGACRVMDATVLLVMDVQRGIIERFAQKDGYLERLSEAVTAARAADVAGV